MFRLLIIIPFAFAALIAGALVALPAPQKEYARVDINGASVLAEVARDPHTRQTGLGGRKSIPRYGGMLFMFDEARPHRIWMKGMEAPIDVLWIRDGRVVDLEENVKPPPRGVADVLLPVYEPDVPADFVLETRAGFAKSQHVRIGDEVKIFFRQESGGESARKSASLSSEDSDISPDGVDSGEPLPVADEARSPEQRAEVFFIENLRKEGTRGSDFRIVKSLGETAAYQKFLISYLSDNLTISGVMNVPKGKPSTGGYPVLILNHGLIAPEIYFSGRGSKREQDFFTRQGYITIHSDYRGYAASSPNPSLHHDFYVGYTVDVINLIDALKAKKSSLFDANRIGMWGHSMGGGLAARVMVLRPEVKAFVLFAPLSADVEDNFYELNEEELGWLAEHYGVGSEARALYEKMSPLSYFHEVSAPVQLHHGINDNEVPFAFSQKMVNALKAYGKKVELYTYPGEKHEFADAWEIAAERAAQFFDRYVK